MGRGTVASLYAEYAPVEGCKGGVGWQGAIEKLSSYLWRDSNPKHSVAAVIPPS